MIDAKPLQFSLCQMSDDRKAPYIVQSHFHDFMTELTPASVDLILTDPPYTISRKTGFESVVNGVQRFAVSMDFGSWDHVAINLTDMAEGFYRALRVGGTAIVWYDLWKLSELKDAMANAGFRMFRQIIWQKTNPVPLNMKSTYLSNSREMAIVGVKGGSPTFNSEYDNGIYELPIPRHNGHRQHPTQKSLALFVELIQKHSLSGDMVVDPFCGAGTTAVAAIRNGRRFAGCDIDSQYVAIAQQAASCELHSGVGFGGYSEHAR